MSRTSQLVKRIEAMGGVSRMLLTHKDDVADHELFRKAFRSVGWYSWPEQTRSMEKLLSYEFQWVLPGHGDINHDDAQSMHEHCNAACRG